MKISDIFYVYTGSKLDFNKQSIDSNGINFVSRNSNNNGVVGKIKQTPSMKTYQKGDITVPLGGSYLLSAFVQNEDFVTAQNIAVLRAKHKMSEIEKWFYCYVLRMNRFKFSAFGREVNKYIKDIEIPNNIPKWVYEHKLSMPISKNISNNKKSLDFSKWETFKFSEIFNIRKGFYNKKPLHLINTDTTLKTSTRNIPFLGASEKNNGITEYYSRSEIEKATKTGDGKNVDITDKIFPAKAVCVTNNGSTGLAYYMDSDFTCSHDVNPLYRKDGDFNVFTGIFVATVIMQDKYRWQYGRKWRPIRMINSELKLPSKNGKPDWEYMENYIKSLSNSDLV
ncbi:TPA: restriction endonuclease subunit S [Pasteurella multocida]|nr:restriction endonuclease subunit S [Pasteurella multocida]